MGRGQDLHELLAGAESLVIVCHDNPDPDSLASAMALHEIASDAGVEEVTVLYAGDISHQQNRAFVNLLELELEQFSVESLTAGDIIAFVDHSVPGQNNRVPAEVDVDVVVDHHPAENVVADFIDRREGYGATATIFVEYLDELGIDVDTRLATALMFALRRETLEFLRGVSGPDFAAAERLQEAVDMDLLRKVAHPSISEATIDAISDAIDNRIIRGSVLISHAGRTTERDALPQAADYLSDMEGVDTTVIFGLIDDVVEISARSTDSRIHIGDALKAAFGDVGSAGGHRQMAGGQIPLGLFADYADDGGLVDIVETIVTQRLVDELHLSDRNDDSE
ncbi:DHH family phosphoesterase [Haloarchaeobius sp. DYHT-AS-18]|uniref:DHH family phosphoesterase n=1 Tax=Haloarchaeobius sp. DYHT-AS-18 TaxID=3446117 RepID=UPI003EBB0DCB